MMLVLEEKLIERLEEKGLTKYKKQALQSAHNYMNEPGRRTSKVSMAQAIQRGVVLAELLVEYNE